MTPRGTLGLCCVHIAQLMSHLAVYTLSFTLQLCYKPLRILQRVTKSQKVHISSYDVLQISHTCEEVEAHLRISFWHLLMSFEKPKKSEFWKNEKKKRKIAGISSFYTSVPKNTIRYSSWDTEWDKYFFVILGHFLPFNPPRDTPENQYFEKMKKVSADVIILNLCHKKQPNDVCLLRYGVRQI